MMVEAKLENAGAALVTGGGSGIGQAIAVALAKRGMTVTILDYNEEWGNETLRMVEEEYEKVAGKKPSGDDKPPGIMISLDIRNSEELVKAFALHETTYGRLDVCVNSAGGPEKEKFDGDESVDGMSDWRRVIDLNLVGVIDCTRLAVQLMRRIKRPGVVLNVGSAAGLYPVPQTPIYSATKGGVTLFTRSLSYLAKEGIRVNVLCPEFVKTRMTEKFEVLLKQTPTFAAHGYMDMEDVVNGALELIDDESKAAACLWLTKWRGAAYWPTYDEKK